MPPKAPPTLEDLALKLAADGPVKTLPAQRLVQLLFNGQYIVRTAQALFVWEHPFYPQLYFPLAALTSSQASDFTAKQGPAIQTPDKSTVVAHRWTLSVGSRATDACLVFAQDLAGPAAALAGLVKVDFAAVDQWFEEATPIFVHPKDPFCRVDVLQSTRLVRVWVHGVLVAETRASMHLYETGLPCRYYMPLTDVKAEVLRRSETRTQCPYKGEAEYYSVDLGGGRVVQDVVWFYNRPTIECGKIEGLVCFYNEKVDIELDGEMLERPDTHFSKVKPGVKPSAV